MKNFLLMSAVMILLLTGAAQAVFVYNTGDMVWATENGGVLTLSSVSGAGPDVTVTFSCDENYALGDGQQGITETMTGIGYDYGGYGQDPTVTFIFSQDVEQVKLSIHDLDSFESLRSMNPMPDSVYDENGYLYISGDGVQASEYNVHGDLMYDEILATDTLSFTFNQNYSTLGLVNLRFSVVPEPATLLLLGLGASLLRKRK